MLRKKTIRERNPREYKSWRCMRNRCNNANYEKYQNYGGRGIGICGAWDSFETFLEDMGARPPNTSIDRIDNDGDYSPENCRWATPKMQNRNKRPHKNSVDVTGKRFGRLTPTHIARRNRKCEAMWSCVCDCGKITVVRLNHLKSGQTKSCGCISSLLRKRSIAQ